MKKKLLAVSFATIMAVSFAVPSYGAEAAVVNSSAGCEQCSPVLEYDETLTTDSQKCEVEVAVGSSFIVTIPKKITLDGGGATKGRGVYEVTVDADLAGTEQIIVTPMPKEGGYVLKEMGGKDDIAFTVSQSFARFIAAESVSTNMADEIYLSKDAIDGYARVNPEAVRVQGTVEAAQISAGTWNGAFDFCIELTSKESGII